MTDEEKKALQIFVIDGMPRTVDEIKSRRKKKGDFQYEVSWKNLPSIKYNKWFMREVWSTPRNRCLIAHTSVADAIWCRLRLMLGACSAHAALRHLCS